MKRKYKPYLTKNDLFIQFAAYLILIAFALGFTHLPYLTKIAILFDTAIIYKMFEKLLYKIARVEVR